MHPELTPEELVNTPAYQLWLASNAWVRWLRRKLLPHGITHVQFSVIAAVARLGTDDEAVSQAQISRFTSMDENMVSQVVRSLTKRGLLDRRPDPADRRSQRIALTPEGRNLYDLARQAVREAADVFFGGLSQSSRDKLVKSLQTINERMSILLD